MDQPPLQPPQPMQVTSTEFKTEKKRKRPAKRTKKTETTPRATATTPPPTLTLIIDNGGHTIKYGWATSSKPRTMPNMTAKLLHQWTILVGDELLDIQPHQLESTSRSTERGIITNFSNQIQVWKRILDNLGIIVPTATEASQVFGWKVARASATQKKATILPTTCAVLLLMPPLCPRVVLEQCMNIWFQEFSFGHVGFAVSPVMASMATTTTTTRPCSLMVDIAWSSIHAVPTYHHAPILANAIRRVPLGGRHLIQLWKYYTSYRQWNLMDQEALLESVLEQLGYVSLDFGKELKTAQRLPLGKRPFDREFVLPDYSTTYEGFVRLPPALLREEQAKEIETTTAEAREERKEASIKEEEKEDDTNKDSGETNNENKDTNDDQSGEDDDDDDDDEESDEAKRQRILRQRQEEERRRQELEAERQVLLVSVERFCIPEVLFRPTDAGLAPNLAGLPQAIVASISACPQEYHAALYQSIRLVGGLSQLPNLQERLQRELRCLAPCQYDVHVEIAKSPVNQAWMGARKWLQQKPYSEWSICMSEWESSKKDSRKPKAWHRLLADSGGAVV